VQEGIIEKYDQAPLGNGYSLRLDSAEFFSFSVYSGTTQKGISTTGSATPFRGADLNTWNHVAGVYNPTGAPQMLIYKNGNRDATTSANAGQEPVAAPTDGSEALQIGKDYGANAFNGNIDEVRIYSRALNDAEVGVLNTMVQPAAGTLSGGGLGGQAILNWGAASNAGSVNIVYNVLRGTSPGVYDTVINVGNVTTYTDTPPASGTYYYNVVAISVIPSAYQTEVSATVTTAPPPPPPPPPAPRTSKVGNENDPCGCGSTVPPGSAGLLGALVMAAVLLLPRRTR
jgi:hypothetical protein